MIPRTALIHPPMNKNYITYLILGVGLLCMPFGVHAQKQYWGRFPGNLTMPVDASGRFGGIVRVDSSGMNPEIVLAFDTAFSSSLGTPTPGAGLMQASNGLIYYMTQQNMVPYHSRIIALDPVTDTAWTVAELGGDDFPWRGQRATSSLVEYTPGQIVEVTSWLIPRPAVFRFDIASHALSFVSYLTAGTSPLGYPYYPSVLGTLSKATDGKLYVGDMPWEYSSGKLLSINPATQSYSILYDCTYDVFAGYSFNGNMIQLGNKIYALTEQGGATFAVFPETGLGTIGAYDLTTGVYSKLLDLDSTAYSPYRGFTAGPSGLLYFEARGDQITDPGTFLGIAGCLAVYDPVGNTVVRKVNYAQPPLGFANVGEFLSPGLLSASNGRIYGSFQKGLFEYDPVADTLRLRAPLQYLHNGIAYPHGLSSPLIEICRKPNYKPRSTTTFTVCEGSYFSYDLHNVNAASVVWRRNGQVVPTQADQHLEFSVITAADAGTWACTLTNECGVTEPPPITITVHPGSFTTSTIGGDTLLCGHGDSAVLTGNNGGTWSTGATTPTLAVTEPGTYYVTNTSACGTSMSNLLHVAHMDSARAPALPFLQPQAYICPGDSLQLAGNLTDAWGVTPTGIWSTGDTGNTTWAKLPGWYYVTTSNACNTDTSANRLLLEFQPEPPPPGVAFFDGFGNPADNLLCTGDSVRMHILNAGQPFWMQDGSWIGDGDLWVSHSSGGYQAATYHCGQIMASEPITITMDSAPPDSPPTIIPDIGTLSGCLLDTVFISTDDMPAYWSWTDADGMEHRDTTTTLAVDWAIMGSYMLTAYNGCGTGPSSYIAVYGEPPTEAAYAEVHTLTCINHPAFTLAPGTPPGGTYSGPGVSGNTFDPASAGVGTHAITYSYGEGNCMAQATDSITVNLCTGIEEAGGGSGIRIHPNPNAGEFTVEVGRSFKQGRLLLYDAQGKQVGKAVPLQPGSNTITRRGLAQGVYHLRVELDGQTIDRSLVVQPGR